MSSEISRDEPSRTNPLTPADILNAAADLLEKPGAWTQKAVARDANGNPCANSTDAEAVCWCGLGAIWRHRGRASTAIRRAERLADLAVGSGGMGDFIMWNDTEGRTQAEVVAALRKAATLSGEPSQ